MENPEEERDSETYVEKLTRGYTTARLGPSFGGLQRLENFARKRADKNVREKTLDWSRGFDAYNLHKPTRKKFDRRKTIVSGPGVQLQADLLDVASNASRNDDVKYLLTIVDAFSKKAWAVPLLSKKGPEVANALRAAVGNLGYSRLQTDKGREFLNVDMRSTLRDLNMTGFTTENAEIKAAIVERFNRVLKKKIYTLLTFRRDGRYIDDLQDLVFAYNQQPGRVSGVAPADVKPSNTEEVYNRMFEDGAKPPGAARLALGDNVRMSINRGTFARGYTANWSREIFIVTRVRSWVRPIVYELKDLADEPVKGTFYDQELQKVDAPTEFLIEKVLRTRGRRPNRELFVKWEAYPESFNSWIKEADVV